MGKEQNTTGYARITLTLRLFRAILLQKKHSKY